MQTLFIMTKQKILDWFRNDRSFETGKQLYMKHGVNLSFKNIPNRAGNTPDNLKLPAWKSSNGGSGFVLIN